MSTGATATAVTGAPIGEAPTIPARLPVVRVQARPGWIGVNWREMWQFRDLLGFLASRDIKVRYKQTLLGVAWAVIQPMVKTLIFFVFFHKLAGVKAEGPYLLFTFAAMLVWQLFESSLTQSSNSLVANQQLLTKVYFPRLIIPISAVLSGLMDFLIGVVLLVPMMAWFKVVPSAAVLTLPLWIAFALLAALAVGLWLSALNVQYRDIRYVVPFLIQVWFFMTPVIYPTTILPERWRFLYGLNPMSGVVSGFRWALLPGHSRPDAMIWVSLGTTFALLAGGLFYFRRMEKTFADVV